MVFFYRKGTTLSSVKWSRSAALLAGIVALLLGGCSSLANQLLMFPSFQPILTAGARIEIEGRTPPVSGARLELFYEEFGPGGSGDPDVEPEVYILALTGNAGRAETTPHCAEQILPAWFRAGVRIGVLALQYPGYGGSGGEATLESLAAAGLDAFDHLHAGAAGRPVVVYGFSLGSTVALHVARQRESCIAGLILEKPLELRSLILGRHGWWNLWLLATPVAFGVPGSVCSASNAAAITSLPAVFLVAERDVVIPPRYQRKVIDAYRAPARVVSAPIDHNQAFTAENTPDLGPAMEWLLEKVRSRSTGGVISSP